MDKKPFDFKDLMQFGMFLIALMLITYIPQISEFLPALLSTK